jgi:hypothetical protein
MCCCRLCVLIFMARKLLYHWECRVEGLELNFEFALNVAPSSCANITLSAVMYMYECQWSIMVKNAALSHQTTSPHRTHFPVVTTRGFDLPASFYTFQLQSHMSVQNITCRRQNVRGYLEDSGVRLCWVRAVVSSLNDVSPARWLVQVFDQRVLSQVVWLTAGGSGWRGPKSGSRLECIVVVVVVVGDLSSKSSIFNVVKTSPCTCTAYLADVAKVSAPSISGVEMSRAMG